MSTLTKEQARTDNEAREGVLRELHAVESRSSTPPELEDLRRRMPQANGDQDAW